MSVKPLDFSKHNLMVDPAKAGSRGCLRRSYQREGDIRMNAYAFAGGVFSSGYGA